jgi:phage baseplate assembly protein gpV
MFGMFGGMGGDACREGTVTEVFPERHSARVKFNDLDNLVSAEMPVLTLAAGKNKSYWLPDIDEKVVCLMASNSGQSGGGYIIGSLYTGKNKPAEKTADIYALKFSDNASISYKRGNNEDKNHILKMHLSDNTEILFENQEKARHFQIKFSDGCKISYDYGDNAADFKMQFKDGSKIEHDGKRGDLDFDIKGEVNIKARGEINIESSQDVNVKGTNIHLN